MKLIKPSVEILEQAPGIQGMYDMIELCGKTSYKSPVKGGKEAENFVNARINEGHYAVLEFGTVYLKIPVEQWDIDKHEFEYIFPDGCPWVEVNCSGEYFFVTTNFRYALRTLGITDIEKYWSEPLPEHIKKYCAKFITDRGVSHELVRHRAMSFCQESTRYCNYSKDKFGNELTFIIPSWINRDEDAANALLPLSMAGAMLNEEGKKQFPFYLSLLQAETSYLKLLESGFTPQQARQVLPNALKTEICMCGFEDDWTHFFDLRYRGTTGKPHPDMLNVATMLHDKFKTKGILL